jgi:large subunit ribosomal protein L35Ae
MKGVIANFRGGRHTQYNNQMIVIADGVDSKDKASKLVGKKVVWTSPAKKQISGDVRSAHGSKGALRVLFEKGMPGQSIGQSVEIKS